MAKRNMVTEACWHSRRSGEQFPPGALQSKSKLRLFDAFEIVNMVPLKYLVIDIFFIPNVYLKSSHVTIPVCDTVCKLRKNLLSAQYTGKGNNLTKYF